MKRFLTILVFAAIVFGANAQEKKGGHNRSVFDSEHIAYLTSEMELTVEEAQVFWPVYNQFAQEQRQMFKEYKVKFGALKKALKEGDEAAISAALKDVLDQKTKQKDVFAEHAAEIQAVVGPVKAAKFYVAEENFRSRQMHRLGQRHGQGQKYGPGHGKGHGNDKGQDRNKD